MPLSSLHPTPAARRSAILAARVDASAARLLEALERSRWNPDQPRIPAGETGGGRWTDGNGSWTGGDRPPRSDRIRVADASPIPSPEFLTELKRRIDAADERLAIAYARASSGLEISHAEIDRAQLAIAEKAVAEIGSTEWAWGTTRPPYGSETFKCNLFVHDILRSVETNPPLVNGDRLYNWVGFGSAKYPLLAGQWGDAARDIPGWSIVSGPPLPGDVIAKKEQGDSSSGHTAIYVGEEGQSGRTVGAGTMKVNYTEWPWRETDQGARPVIRRFRGERRP